MLQVLDKIKQPAKFQRHIFMHPAVMRICISCRLSIIWAQNGIMGGFDGEDVKILCSNPRKALPCVNKRMMVYRRQNRFNGLSSRSVQDFAYKEI